MLTTKVTVHVQQTGMLPGDQALQLSDAVMRKWRLQANQSIPFRFGGFRTTVSVGPISRTSALHMSSSLSARLGIPDGAALRLSYRGGELAAGPLIGLLMSRYYASTPDQPFGTNTTYCKEVVEACRQSGAIAYFFTPGQIEKQRATVQGWTYANGRWTKGMFPIPDVVYNRLTSRKLENKPSVQQFFQEVKSRHGKQVFNEKYLDKTDVFAALKNDSALTKYLPESYLLKSFDTMKMMCEKYKAVYIKPVRGSLGKGIIRVSRSEGGAVTAYISTPNGAIRKQYPSIAKLYTAISPKLKSQKYQIQQGIQLATAGGRPVDFRGLVQKGLDGKWDVTSIVGRIAGSNQIVSNLARGGTISSAASVLARMKLGRLTRKAANDRLSQATFDIAEGIDRNIDGHFGELGVDLGLDTSGRVWLIEVNSKPSKNDNTQLTENKIRPSVKQLVAYSRHLSGL